MNARHDLTRWNRAGLSRFRYIDGNAATFLEALRLALIERFSDGEAGTLQWQSLVPRQEGDPPDDEAYNRLLLEQARIQDETEREYLDRIIKQYDGERRDWGWEIARVLARSAHVLTEYIDAYANEGFLRTATQWDNVRRLVEMLDYHPAPPASAATLLVIEAKPEAGGVLEAGFQVKYAPPEGGAPVVFETLTDIVIDADLNLLRPADYDRSQDQLEGSLLVLESEVEDLEIGDPLVLEDEKTGVLHGHRIQGLQAGEGTTGIRVSPEVSSVLLRGYTQVHLESKDRLDALGPAVQETEVGSELHLTAEPQDLQPDTVVYIDDGDNVYYRRLTSVRGKQLKLKTEVGRLRLDLGRVGSPISLEVIQQDSLQDDAEDIYRFKTAGDWSYLAEQHVAKPEESLPVCMVTEASYAPVADGTNEDEGFTTLVIQRIGHAVSLDNTKRLLVPAAVIGPWQVDTYLESVNGNLPGTLTAGLPKKTSAGDLAVVDNGRHMAWARLGAVTVDEKNQEADLIAEDAWLEDDSGEFFLTETTILAHFKTTARLKDWQVNNRTLTGNRIPLSTLPAALEKGRSLMVENTDDPAAAFAATVAAVDATQSPVELVLSQDLPAGQTYGNTLIATNVVSAGHGETKGEKVLGSGDATRLSQSFVLGDTNVSFVADATQSAGVKAAIEVKVADRIWEQVAGFQNSRPADAHYTVRMTEDSHLKVTFGDGRHGRRLPTGSNNVRLTYRKGTGLGGNLDAGCFTKAARPHHLVDKVRQPLRATGGNDMEGLMSLQENAPATLLTLERAVSLEDFNSLVMSQSSVWQAKAFARPTGLGRNQKIEVVVVPAGGGELGTLAGSLTDFILAHAVPGLEVLITAYRHRTFALEVLITVDGAAYNPEEVAAAVNAALEEAFSLQHRKLNQDLFLSEVYQVVETVTGVVHSQAVINANGAIRRLSAGDRDVLILGQLLVAHQGDEATTIQPAPTVAAQAKSSSRLIGRGKVQMIQGIGARYAERLQNSGIHTFEDLHRLDPLRPPAGIPKAKLNEFKTKAELVLSLDVDKALAAPLLDRSLFDLLQTSTAALARDSGQTLEFSRQLHSKLRVLKITLDEDYLETITLRKLLTELSAG